MTLRYKFCKNLVRINLHAQCKFMSAEGVTQQVPPTEVFAWDLAEQVV